VEGTKIFVRRLTGDFEVGASDSLGTRQTGSLTEIGTRAIKTVSFGAACLTFFCLPLVHARFSHSQVKLRVLTGKAMMRLTTRSPLG
jgi:hypothetical protein